MRWSNPFRRISFINNSRSYRGDDLQEDLDFADECSIPGHLDLVDEAALGILSHDRVRVARAKTAVCILGVAGVISLAIGSGMIYAKRYTSNEGTTSSLSTATSSSAANHTRYKAYIDKICTSEAVSSTNGRLKCMDACADSTCCRTENLEENCMADFSAVCLEFEACNILSDNNTTSMNISIPMYSDNNTSNSIIKASQHATVNNNIADMLLLTADIQSFTNTNSSLNPHGVVSISSYSNYDIRINLTITGLDSICSPTDTGGCGIHIHEGFNCDTSDEVMGHYWNQINEESLLDPWLTTTYSTNEVGTADGSIWMLGGNGYSVEENNGHAIVVHDRNGKKVGCGVLMISTTKDGGTITDNNIVIDKGTEHVNNSSSGFDTFENNSIEPSEDVNASSVSVGETPVDKGSDNANLGILNHSSTTDAATQFGIISDVTTTNMSTTNFDISNNELIPNATSTTNMSLSPP